MLENISYNKIIVGVIHTGTKIDTPKNFNKLSKGLYNGLILVEIKSGSCR